MEKEDEMGLFSLLAVAVFVRGRGGGGGEKSVGVFLFTGSFSVPTSPRSLGALFVAACVSWYV